ncbi:MAG TPA: hypothetical protein VFP87_10405 [Chitinophagaceae bacterium]|nr:hypothetical protein [Chitinophagaceae bacterium]
MNNQLPKKDAVNFYPSDIPLNWDKVDSANFKAIIYPLVRHRDSIIAARVAAQFDKISSSPGKRKKALVIMNYRHAFNKSMYTDNGQEIKNVGGFLFQRYGNRVANVYLNAIGFDAKNNYLLLQEGKWDAAFSVTGNKSVGFDLHNTPFGMDGFDYWPFKTDLTYQDIFTGFVFYQPLDSQRLVTGVPGFVDSTFFDEFIRRYQLSTILLTNLTPLTKEQIDQSRKDLASFQKNFNELRRGRYPHLDSLLKTRDRWLLQK